MPNRDPRIDAYIARAAEFARPILEHLREIVHEGCPAVQETIKWGMPHFDHHGIMASMAAFKAHASFGFWKASLIVDAAGRSAEAGMGQFGRITSISDLPPRRVLVGYVRQAAKLNEQGVKSPTRSAAKAKPKSTLVPSPPFAAALRREPAARAGFDALSPSHRREYVEWIAEAKREETRERRLVTALEWLAEGKPLHWRYDSKHAAPEKKKAAAKKVATKRKRASSPPSRTRNSRSR